MEKTTINLGFITENSVGTVILSGPEPTGPRYNVPLVPPLVGPGANKNVWERIHKIAILKQLQTHFKTKREKCVGTPFPRVPTPLHHWTMYSSMQTFYLLSTLAVFKTSFGTTKNENMKEPRKGFEHKLTKAAVLTAATYHNRWIIYMEALAVSREYFKHAVVEFWSKIQKRCLHLPQRSYFFFFFKTSWHQYGRRAQRGAAQCPGLRITMGAPNHYGERRMTAGAP